MNKQNIFNKIIEQIKLKKEKDKAFVIGINGIDGSGKTEFSKQLSEYLILKGFKTQIIHLDSFLNEKSIRYAGDLPEHHKFFHQSYDIDKIINELLNPIKKGIFVNKILNLLDLHKDSFTLKSEYKIDTDTIIIFEGVFLFRNEFINYFDYKILLKLTFEEQLNRAKNRDVPVFGEQILEKYRNKYIPAQEIYFKKFIPEQVADMIIDNEDFDKPYITKQLS